jgi:TIR domain
MAAFVPGCKHDIFVSYAHVDDNPDVGADAGWVTSLVRGLNTRLGWKLGRSDSYSLWIDPRLSGNERITDQIMGALNEVATVMVILSPGYLASEWCQREKNKFLSLIQDRIRSGSRVFVVERDKVEPRPPEFEDLKGYRFWVEDREGRPPRILGTPKPDPNDKNYYDLLTDLSSDLVSELVRLKQLGQPAKQTPKQVMEPNANTGIFLAQVTEDIDLQRNEVKRYLEQVNFRVLPDTSLYSLELDIFQKAVDRDLINCKYYVQLLSEHPGRKLNNSSETYPRLQYARAKLAGKPILQWRNPGLDVEAVADPEHRAFLHLDTVSAMGLEEFKREILQKTKSRSDPKKRAPINAFVFVDSETGDFRVASEVCEALDRYGVGYALPLAGGSVGDLREDLKENLMYCDVLVIIYGSVTPLWVRRKLSEWRRIAQDRVKPLKALAVYDGPPELKAELNFKLPGMKIINCRKGLNEAELEKILDELGQDN